jgi:cysteine desulfurase
MPHACNALAEGELHPPDTYHAAMSDAIYLDSNATTRPADSVVEVMVRAVREGWANPSSIHRPGQLVRQQVELARHEVAQLLGCRDREIVFTSGGTESANLAIRGTLAGLPNRRVLVTNRIEHSTVRELAEKLDERGIAEVVWLPLKHGGLIDLDALRDLLLKRADEIALVSVMWVNNETGLIQPIEEVGSLCGEHGVRFHTDATQAVGKMPIDLAVGSRRSALGDRVDADGRRPPADSAFPIDLLTFSAHKFHGPKGIGGLYVREGIRIEKQQIGGPQERERRGGTENVPGILGMGEAARLAREWLRDPENAARQAELRDRLEKAILDAVPDASVNSVEWPRLWTTSNIAFAGLEAEPILLMLSERGVCASAGAACSSGSLEASPVIAAIGISHERAGGSVRFSISRETTDDEIDRATEIIHSVIERLRAAIGAA